MTTIGKAISNFTKTFVKQFFEDRCFTYAASLAFTTLVSIVPLFIFIFYILSFFPQLQITGNQIEQFIFQNFVVKSADAISLELQEFLKNVSVISWWNVSVLIFFAAMLIIGVVDAINNVWHTTFKSDLESMLRTYMAPLITVPVFFLLIFLAGSYVISLPLFTHISNLSLIKMPLYYTLPMIIEWIAFTLFHWVLPSCRVRFSFAMIAGVFTLALFEIAKWGFMQYLYFSPTYKFVYGALATIPIFFMWIYISWVIIIAGALMCSMLQHNSLTED